MPKPIAARLVYLLPSQRRQVEVVVGAVEDILARVGRVRVVHHAVLMQEVGQAGWLAVGAPAVAICFERGLVLVVVLDRGYRFILGGVEVVIEVGPERRVPGNGQPMRALNSASFSNGALDTSARVVFSV